MLAATFLLPFLAYVAAAPAWTSSPLEPAAIPLAVRSPYLSAWLAGGHALSESWPTFWTGSVVGWASYARVDGTAFRTMGLANIDGAQVAQQTSVSVNASTTQFVLRAGGVELLYTFLSPVEPNDLARQSLPLSYMSVTARSVDGVAHDVQVYTDISAEWVSGDVQKTANWSLEKSTDGRTLIHKVQLADEQLFTEINDRIEHGSAYLATTSSASLTYSQGPDVDTRTAFVKDGRLANQLDTKSRAISDSWPVFAFASSLGSVPASGVVAPAVVFAIGHARDQVVQYVTRGGALQQRAPYWQTKWATATDAIAFFLGDYDAALASATALDARIQGDAFSANYASIMRVSLRQALAAVELTVSKKADGSLDASDVLAFMKEISSNGNMNTVDVVTPFWPLALYANPVLGKYLLEPLFKYQTAGLYPNKYAVHDLGAHYPNATGHNDGQDEAMPLEECGNMLIMALSYAQRSGDTSQIKQYAVLLAQWAQFLISNALVPASQISTDDFAGALGNQTNLAIKGIVGIAAMGEISKLTGDSARAASYSSLAKDYVTRWRALATSHDKSHLKLNYGDDASWGIAYNLYADKLLGLNVFPQDVYDMQTAWYKSKLTTFGIPLDTRHTYTKSDWEIWAAAISDDALKSAIVDSVYRYAGTSDVNSGAPLGDLYETSNGSTVAFRARPVVGGHFAILALQQDKSLSKTGSSGSSGGNTSASPGGSSNGSGDGNVDANDGDGGAASLVVAKSWVVVLVLCAVGSLVYL